MEYTQSEREDAKSELLNVMSRISEKTRGQHFERIDYGARNLTPIYPTDTIEKIIRLTHESADIIGAYLLQGSRIVTGRCYDGIDEMVSNALMRLSHIVSHDVNPCDGIDHIDGGQTVVGDMRFVIHQLGPAELKFQVGVAIRVKAGIGKSLQRKIRQIDRAFRKELKWSESIASSMAKMGIGSPELPTPTCRCWHYGLEYDLWDLVIDKSPRRGMGEIEASHTAAMLSELAKVADGWWIWDKDMINQLFVPLKQWLKLYFDRRDRKGHDDEKMATGVPVRDI